MNHEDPGGAGAIPCAGWWLTADAVRLDPPILVAVTATPGIVSVKTLTEGFLGAHDRLHTALRDWREPASTFVPLFETLNWLVAIDDRLQAEGHHWEGDAAKLIRATRYVRGRVHHQWAEAFELREDVQLDRVWLGVAPGPTGVFL